VRKKKKKKKVAKLLRQEKTVPIFNM
jgi:ribosomal protein L39E